MANVTITDSKECDVGDCDEINVMDMLQPTSASPTWPWLLLWSLHNYLLGTVYLFLACHALVSVLFIFCRTSTGSSQKRVSSIRTCLIAIKILLVIFGTTRALYMYLYLKFWHDTGIPWKIVENILSNVAYPCLTGGFGIMCQVLYEASRLRARSTSKVLRSKIIILFIIMCHFIAVITAVTLIELMGNFVLMLLICHGFFIIWGIFLVVTFTVFARKLSKAERTSTCVIADMKHNESVSYGASTIVKPTQITHISSLSTPQPISDSNIGKNGSPKMVVMEAKTRASTSSEDADGIRCEKRNNNYVRKSTRLKSRKQSVGESEQENHDSSKHSAIINVNVFKTLGRNLNKNEDDEVFEQPQNASPKRDSKKNTLSFLQSGKWTIRKRFTASVNSRQAFRLRLTRKVLKIAVVTSVLNSFCIILNSIVVVRGLMGYYRQWKPSQTSIYIFITFFRFIELGMGLTMTYFTTQSVQHGSQLRWSILNRGKKSINSFISGTTKSITVND